MKGIAGLVSLSRTPLTGIEPSNCSLRVQRTNHYAIASVQLEIYAIADTLIVLDLVLMAIGIFNAGVYKPTFDHGFLVVITDDSAT